MDARNEPIKTNPACPPFTGNCYQGRDSNAESGASDPSGSGKLLGWLVYLVCGLCCAYVALSVGVHLGWLA